MKHTKMVSRLFVILALGLGLSACKKEGTSSGGNTIKIGEVGAKTGPIATFGISTRNGVMMAIEEVNAAGGVKGKQIEVISLDDQGKPEEAAIVTTKLITQDKVVAVLGEVASSISLAMAPIAQQYKIPMITPSSTNPEVTKKGDYIFRVCFIDPFQGSVMAKFAFENLKAKNVAILKDIKNDYSMGLSQFFNETFKSLGGNIVVEQSYSANDIDFKAQLTAIRAKKPDAIYVPGYYTDVGLIARQARELGITVPLMGGDGWDSPKLKEIGGKAVDGSYISNHYSSENQDPRVQEFLTKYKAKYGATPDALAAMGYDAAKVLVEAMIRAPSLEPKDIRDAIAVTKDFPGVTGNITLDADRNAVKAAVVLKVENGEFKYQATVNP